MNVLRLDATEQLRRKLLIGMCINLGVASLLLGLANIYYFEMKAYALGLLEILYFFISVGMLAYIRKNTQPKWFLAFHSFVLAFLIVFGTYSKAAEEVLFIWAIAMPTVFYLALGKRLGFYWNLFFFIFEIIAIRSAIPNTSLVAPALFANFVLAYMCVWVVSHAYESSRSKAVERLRTLATQDALTGAKNRLALYEATTIENASEDLEYVMLLDIDDFKLFNDGYGHGVGDLVLIEFVHRIKSIVGDCVYRIGGEEFVILIESHHLAKGGLEGLNSQLHNIVMNNTIKLKENEFTIAFSAGIEPYHKGDVLDVALKKADDSLYQVKQSGKSRTFYEGAELVFN